MRKLTTLITAMALYLALVSPALPANAEGDDDSGFQYDVGTNTGGSGPDVTGTLFLNGKNGTGGQGGGEAHHQIGGETQEQYNARMRAFYDRQAAYCNSMFLDVESQRLLTTVDAINLRNRYMTHCLTPGTASAIVPPNPPPNPAVLGAEAVAQLTLPAAEPLVGPDPSLNKWQMVAVGYPIWLWTEGVTQLTTSASVRGYTVTLVATRASVQFNMGDGTTLYCTSTAHWTRSVVPNTPSPNCGHVYKNKPTQGTTYRVAALATWNVTWSVMGESGTIPVTKGNARQLEVGELQALVVR